jgi:hypothetical protein
MRHQFIIGQSRARQCGWCQILRTGGGVRRAQGICPAWPVFCRSLLCIDPFRQIRDPRQCIRHGARHQFLRDIAGQRINRFVPRQIRRVFGTQHVIGMDHLRNPVKQFYPTRQNAALSRWQYL